MEKQLLIKYDSNYADEFDVDGFVVWPESKWEEHKAAITKWFENRAAKRGPCPVLPPHTDPNYYKVYDQVRKWERGQEVERGFGTNESVSYCDAADYFRCFKVTEITAEEYEALKRLFKEEWRETIRFGMFLDLEDVLEDEEEYSEDDEDEEDE